MSLWTRMMQTLTVLWCLVLEPTMNRVRKKLAVVELPLEGFSSTRASMCQKKKRDEYVSTTNKQSMTTAMLSMTPFCLYQNSCIYSTAVLFHARVPYGKETSCTSVCPLGSGAYRCWLEREAQAKAPAALWGSSKKSTAPASSSWGFLLKRGANGACDQFTGVKAQGRRRIWEPNLIAFNTTRCVQEIRFFEHAKKKTDKSGIR
jgi:hypothetical protein